MKKIFIILFSLISISLGATTWYIDPAGSDATGNGTVGNPWYSLSYACSQVNAAGDKIFVNAGSYTDNNQCTLSLGVSIEGDPYTPFSNITTSYVATGETDGYIVAASAADNAVNGNQSISYIRINGNSSAATRAMYTAFRSNVIIHHCTFTDFYYQGIRLNGTVSFWRTTPTNIIPTGNEVHHCTFTNCSNLPGNNGGHIRPEGQNGIKIYSNTFTQTGAALGNNTDIFAGYQNEGMQIYDNIFYRNDYENGEYNIYTELHYNRGGFQMYGNTFNGAATFDFAGSVVGTWGFGAYIHDNTFQTSAPPPSDTHREAYLDLETYTYMNDVYVYRNYFKFGRMGIHLDNIEVSANNIWIYDNIFEDIGNATDNYSYGIKVESNWNSGEYGIPIDNLYIYNNVIDAGTSAYAGIMVSVLGTITNCNIRNNIINGNFNYSVRFDSNAPGADVDTLNINTNNFFGTDNLDPFYSADIDFTGRTETGNITTNPLFVSVTAPTDWHLQSGSLAVGAGTHIGTPVLLDYDELDWLNPPSIGAYEYGVKSETVAEVTTTGITNIVTTTASSGGYVSDDGGASVTARGVVWDVSTAPTIALATKTSDGSGTGSFVSLITGLTVGLTYYVRAYATNSEGTAYGNELTFVAGTPNINTTRIVKNLGKIVKMNGLIVKQ